MGTCEIQSLTPARMCSTHVSENTRNSPSTCCVASTYILPTSGVHAERATAENRVFNVLQWFDMSPRCSAALRGVSLYRVITGGQHVVGGGKPVVRINGI